MPGPQTEGEERGGKLCRLQRLYRPPAAAAALLLLFASMSCGPLGSRSRYCPKESQPRPRIALLSTVVPRFSFERASASDPEIGLSFCGALQPLQVPTGADDHTGGSRRYGAARPLTLEDARKLGLAGRFLLVELGHGCGIDCQPQRFSYQHECGSGPILTHLRVLEGTRDYPLRMDEVMKAVEAHHRRLLPEQEQEIQALLARQETRGWSSYQETGSCWSGADRTLQVTVRTARVRHLNPCTCRPGQDCRDCFMLRRMVAAVVASQYDLAPDGRILRVRKLGPVLHRGL